MKRVRDTDCGEIQEDKLNATQTRIDVEVINVKRQRCVEKEHHQILERLMRSLGSATKSDGLFTWVVRDWIGNMTNQGTDISQLSKYLDAEVLVYCPTTLGKSLLLNIRNTSSKKLVDDSSLVFLFGDTLETSFAVKLKISLIRSLERMISDQSVCLNKEYFLLSDKIAWYGASPGEILNDTDCLLQLAKSSTVLGSRTVFLHMFQGGSTSILTTSIREDVTLRFDHGTRIVTISQGNAQIDVDLDTSISISGILGRHEFNAALTKRLWDRVIEKRLHPFIF